MSSELGMRFGKDNGSIYGTIISNWVEKLKGVDEVTPEQKAEWANDLINALGPEAAPLLQTVALSWEEAGLILPASDVLKKFAEIAIKAGLGKHTVDLLKRLHTRVNDSLTASDNLDDDSMETPDTLALRAPQTVAQIFDMVKDAFGSLIERFNKRKGNLTGRRKWQTNSSPSRHSRLDGQIKNDDEDFYYKGEEIYGPRPPGGSPANWSNCSCQIFLETKQGEWIEM